NKNGILGKGDGKISHNDDNFLTINRQSVDWVEYIGIFSIEKRYYSTQPTLHQINQQKLCFNACTQGKTQFFSLL
ncbi:MAG: hypothetical protein RLZZ338_3743, partial [Cyanobacteriota bacterium]